MDNATGKVFYTNYYFLAGANGNSTSFVSKVTFSTSASATSSRSVVGSIEYTYDTNGFISSVTSKNAGGAVTGYEAYTYDALGQLLTVSDGTNTTSYTYDKSGNILTEKYNGTTVGTYTYGDSGWKDLLTAYNGETITYDGIGNPTKYIGWDTLTWSMGRRLMSLSNSTDSVSYTYNADGQRISKTVNGVTTTYYYDDRGTLVLSSCSDGTKLYFYTDADGSISSFEYNGNHYYYVRNAQNDVIGIVDSTGAFVARYTYDAWGNITAITDGAGNDVSANATHIANINPLRYRSYFYDAETGFYYVSSRYYDSDIGRWLNEDAYASTGQGILGHNMFAYCGNNPVVMIDEQGYCYGYANNPDLSLPSSGVNYGINCGSYGVHSRRPKKATASEDLIFVTIDPNSPPDHPDYKPPKKGGGKKVKNPNGKGWGWPAHDGGVWMPEPNMHGGEGWTIQYPGGGHSHAYPGGGVRNHFEPSSSEGASIAMIFVGAVSTIGLILDNFTGIGAADDYLIASSASCFISGIGGLFGNRQTCSECGKVDYEY